MAQKYRVTLTYEAIVIMESDADPDGADFERDLAIDSEKYVSPVLTLTDWDVRIASQRDGKAANR